MALPATDDFNGGVQGEQLTTYSANWTLCNGDFDIQLAAADSLAPDQGGAENGAGWNADAFNDDQYAEGVIKAIAAANDIIGVAVRCDTATPDDDFYGWYGNNAESWLFKLVNGAWTQIDAGGPAFGAADTIRIEAEGTTITGYLNAGQEDQDTDASLASGSAGVSGFSDSTGSRLDSWEGGNLGAAARIPRYGFTNFQIPGIV